MRRLSWLSLMLAAVLAGSACGGAGLATQDADEDDPPPSSPPEGDPWDSATPDPSELEFVLEVEPGSSVSFTLRIRNQRDEPLVLWLGWGPALFMVTDPDRKAVWWSGVAPESTGRPDILQRHVFEAGEEKAFTETWNRYTLGGSQAGPGEYLAWVQVERRVEPGKPNVTLAAGPVEFTLE